jgi:hypothetical protein
LDACTLTNGDPCSWFDAQRLVCSNPCCIVKERARLKRLKDEARPPSKYRGWGYGARVLELRREERRRRRRRKGKAA